MLIKCPECGKEISDKAQSCPNCGCPASEFAGSEAIKERTAEVHGIKEFLPDGRCVIYCTTCGKETKLPSCFIKKVNDYSMELIVDIKCVNCNKADKGGTIVYLRDMKTNRKVHLSAPETSGNTKIRYIDDEIPKCPMCRSYNIHKISGASKVASGLAFGVFAGKKIMSQYKCGACGHLF